MVEIQAESTRSAWSVRPQALSAPFTRDLISPAAFEVNVIASTSSMPETNPAFERMNDAAGKRKRLSAACTGRHCHGAHERIDALFLSRSESHMLCPSFCA